MGGEELDKSPGVAMAKKFLARTFFI